MTERHGAIKGSLHSEGDVGIVRMSVRFGNGLDDVWAALSDPVRLARWYGNVEGDLRVGGTFTAFVFGSGWDGRGRIDVCEAPRRLTVTMWEDGRPEGVTSVELSADDEATMFTLEARRFPLEILWAYGAGWQTHVEDLGAHLRGEDRSDLLVTPNPRFDELEGMYQAMSVERVEL